MQHAVRRCNVLHCVATKRTAVRSLRCSCFLLSTRTASCTRTAARARSTATPVALQRCLVVPLVGPLAPLARRRPVRSRSFIPAAAVVAVAPRSAAISTSLTSSASAVLTRQPRRWHVLHYVATCCITLQHARPPGVLCLRRYAPDGNRLWRKNMHYYECEGASLIARAVYFEVCDRC